MSSLEEEEEDSCLLEAGSSTLNYPFNGREKSLNLRSFSSFSSSSSSSFILHVQKRTLIHAFFHVSSRYNVTFVFLLDSSNRAVLDINRHESKKNCKEKGVDAKIARRSIELPIRRGIVSRRKRRGARSCFLIVMTLMSGVP